MATRSTIWIEKANGKFDGIYCHWDGYPEGVGATLKQYFQQKEKVQSLIELGAISCLEEHIDCPKEHSFDHPVVNHTSAYHRDRGEDLSIYRDISLDAINEYKEEYNYVFHNGRWFLLNNDNEFDEF